MNILTILQQQPELFLLLIAFISLLFGSFLNVIIYRLPRIIMTTWGHECREYLGLKPTPDTETEHLSLCLPASHCPHCKKRLKPWQNIPLLSYLLLRGKCAFCKAPISIRYPLVEFITCLASVYVAWRFGVSPQTIAALILTWTVIGLTFIDLEYQILPDQLTFFLLWTGLFLSMFNVFCTPQDAIIGAIIGYLIFALVHWVFKLSTGKNGMGQGDFKFLAALGAFLGWQQLPIIILLASIIGLALGGTMLVLKRQSKNTPLPFGPYLAIAGWISMIWGNEIARLYLQAWNL